MCGLDPVRCCESVWGWVMGGGGDDVDDVGGAAALIISAENSLFH